MSGELTTQAKPNFRDPSYVAAMSGVLMRHYFVGASEAFMASPEGRRDLEDHLWGRCEMFSGVFVPWMRRRYDLSKMRLVEVGCGTGSSTLAFGSVAKSLDCYEISAPSRMIARERLRLFGIGSVKFHSDPFCAESIGKRAGDVDGILLTASLEHMTHDELFEVLHLCERVLRPGGILAVCETPNRFTPIDEHTSFLPLFSMLPPAIQVRYFHHSPRDGFKQAMSSAASLGPKRLMEAAVRWGNGISFHEFEIAYGKGVHSLITLDGYEPEILPLFPLTSLDDGIHQLFQVAGVRVHRAFARRWLNFVLEKPGG